MSSDQSSRLGVFSRSETGSRKGCRQENTLKHLSTEACRKGPEVTSGEQTRQKKLGVLNFLMAARWFSLTPAHCYLIHVRLLFWISIPELDEWLILGQRGLSHYRQRAGAGSGSQADAILLYERAGPQEAVPTFGFTAIMTPKDFRTQLFYQPYFWTH